MNFLRHNIVTLALVVIVAAVTALNSYTTQVGLAEFHMNNGDLVANVAFSEAMRADKLEFAFEQLLKDHLASKAAANELSAELSAACHHIRDCHTLFQKAGVKPPAGLPLDTCPPGCPKCPGKIRPDQDA
jgi:Zn finger protein HypA/HybF involved in hydrogenase expression